MVVTAVVTAIVLFATGRLLLRLLHISGGAVAVGGPIVLAILAINMAQPTKKVEAVVEIREDSKQIAVYCWRCHICEPGRRHDPHHCIRRDRRSRAPPWSWSSSCWSARPIT